ncbi:MAG: carbohydrate-binding domain-containing protein, partial [Oscillospiraceae bacterium]|nr:carbohydrate-binding domain-containing protein [Oscillospiraceae bacterium]
MKKWISLLWIFSLMCCLLAGCGKQNNTDDLIINSNDSGSADSSAESVDVDFSQTDAELFTDRDYRVDDTTAESVTIELNGNSAKASSNSVKISGSTVTITEEATYILSGTLNNGRIVVDADETAKLQIVLNGVDVTAKTSAALYILEADKVFVTLAD